MFNNSFSQNIVYMLKVKLSYRQSIHSSRLEQHFTYRLNGTYKAIRFSFSVRFFGDVSFIRSTVAIGGQCPVIDGNIPKR